MLQFVLEDRVSDSDQVLGPLSRGPATQIGYTILGYYILRISPGSVAGPSTLATMRDTAPAVVVQATEQILDG